MTALSTKPVQISEEAARFMEQEGIQEPYQRILDQIPKRFQAVHSIKVGLEQPVNEGEGPCVAFDVAREHPGGEDDPSGRQFGQWSSRCFRPKFCGTSLS